MTSLTSSKKREVPYITYRNLQHLQRKSEPQPQATLTGNLVKFDHVVFEICKPTDILTHSQTCSSQYSALLMAAE